MEKKEQEKLLHETILELFYLESKDKACELNQNEIFRKLNDPNVSQYKLDQVLAWMVHHKKLNEILGFYTIDKYELLDFEEKLKTKPKEKVTHTITDKIVVKEETAENSIEKNSKKTAIAKPAIPRKKSIPKKTINNPVSKKITKGNVLFKYVMPSLLIMYIFYIFFQIKNLNIIYSQNNNKIEINSNKINDVLQQNKAILLNKNNLGIKHDNNKLEMQTILLNEKIENVTRLIETSFNEVLIQFNSVLNHMLFLFLVLILWIFKK